MLKTIHWCALRISDAALLLSRLADRIWEVGGALEYWADERIYDIERKQRIAAWKEYTAEQEKESA